jgi:hypothetical protein
MIKIQNCDIINEEDNLKIIKIEKNKTRNNCYNLIVECDANVWQRMIEQRKIKIGWNRCLVLDGVDVRRCFNCSQYSHFAKDCKNKLCCPKCSGEHNLKDCRNDVPKYINCENAIKKYKLSNVDVEHAVWSSDCAVYKKVLAAKKRSIQYE